MKLFFALFLLLCLYLLLLELYPVKRLRTKKSRAELYALPELYIYSFELHVHSQFSYDSLGKPEDIAEAARREGIDYVIVTDHEDDRIKHFAGDRIVAGMEKKLLGKEGRVLGDLLLAGELRVVAHPFKEKYRWQLELPEEYLFELIDLKDALLERKGMLFLMLPYLLLVGLLSRSRAVESLKKIIPVEKYATQYLKMRIANRVVGGLDHHVKVYIREVGIRFLFPSYRHSFRLMRNFLLTDQKVTDREQFLQSLKTGSTLISFSEKPTLFWRDGQSLKVFPPAECLLHRKSLQEEEWQEGSFFEFFLPPGTQVFMGYTYAFRLGSLCFGLKPLFLFVCREEENGRVASA